MTERSTGVRQNVGDYYPLTTDGWKVENIHAGVRFGRLKSEEPLIDAVVASEGYDEQGVIDQERLASYREIHERLQGCAGQFVAVVSQSKIQQGMSLNMTVGQLAEGDPLNYRHGSINTPDSVSNYFYDVQSNQIGYYPGTQSQHGIPLRGSDHDVVRPILLGQNETPYETTVLTEEEILNWITENAGTGDAGYEVFIGLGRMLKSLDTEELPEFLRGETAFDDYLLAERTALQGYAEFYNLVVGTNTDFDDNVTVREYEQKFKEVRERFKEQNARLASEYERINWRLGYIRHDKRSWPYMDFDDYEQELSRGITAMSHQMKRETAELRDRLRRIIQQMILVDWLSEDRFKPAVNNERLTED